MAINIDNVKQHPVIWDDADPDFTFVGYSAQRSDAADLEHMIIEKVDNVNKTIYVAEGEMIFNKVWDDRADYDYYPPFTQA